MEDGKLKQEEEEEQVAMESWEEMLHLFNTHTHRSTHMENWRSLASMLRCLMHILVRAEPMSLVPPENKQRDTDDNRSDSKTVAADYWKLFTFTHWGEKRINKTNSKYVTLQYSSAHDQAERVCKKP